MSVYGNIGIFGCLLQLYITIKIPRMVTVPGEGPSILASFVDNEIAMWLLPKTDGDIAHELVEQKWWDNAMDVKQYSFLVQ